MNTLDVVRTHPEQFKVMALTAGQQIDRLALQCLEFKPAIAVLNTTKDAQALSALLRDKGSATTVLFGQEGLIAAVAERSPLCTFARQGLSHHCVVWPRRTNCCCSRE